VTALSQLHVFVHKASWLRRELCQQNQEHLEDKELLSTATDQDRIDDVKIHFTLEHMLGKVKNEACVDIVNTVHNKRTTNLFLPSSCKQVKELQLWVHHNK
jgi:hypothetical protein